MSAPVAVLIGPPGGGKTTAGRLLAERWGVSFQDTDELLAEEAGAPVGEVLVSRGEEAFRVLEAAAAATALESGGVVALGSGALEAEETASRVASLAGAGTAVVLLEVSLAAAAPRLGLNVPRSAALGNARAQLAAMADRRRPRYQELATVTIETSALTPEEVVVAVLGAIS